MCGIDITDCVRIAVLYFVRKHKFAIPHLVRISLVLSEKVRKSQRSILNSALLCSALMPTISNKIRSIIIFSHTIQCCILSKFELFTV